MKDGVTTIEQSGSSSYTTIRVLMTYEKTQQSLQRPHNNKPKYILSFGYHHGADLPVDLALTKC